MNEPLTVFIIKHSGIWLPGYTAIAAVDAPKAMTMWERWAIDISDIDEKSGEIVNVIEPDHISVYPIWDGDY